MQAEKQAEAEKTPDVKPEAKAEKPDVPEKPAAPPLTGLLASAGEFFQRTPLLGTP